MVIRELYVKNFGKLSEKHFYFRDGVQVISGENEFGKTTLHAFVKAMLFGLERGRGRAAAKDDFMPQDGGPDRGTEKRGACGPDSGKDRPHSGCLFFGKQDRMDFKSCGRRQGTGGAWRTAVWNRGYVADLESDQGLHSCDRLYECIENHAV